MKKILCVMLSLLMIFTLITACGDDQKSKTASNAPSEQQDEATLTGKWYGPGNTPVLDIKEDNTGTVKADGKTENATFTTKDDTISIKTHQVLFEGKYVVTAETLTITGDAGKIVFTRTPSEVDKELVGSHYFQKEDTLYELTLEEDLTGWICVLYGPNDTNIGDGESEGTETEGNPPTEPEDDSDNDSGKPKTPITYRVKPGDKPEIELTPGQPGKPHNPDKKLPVDKGEKKPDGTITFPPKQTEDEEITTGGDGSKSLVGSWVSDPQQGTISLFGSSSSVDYQVVFTFNQDGSGQALAVLPLPLTWSVKGNILTVTISAFGQTETGSLPFFVTGDTLYLIDDEQGAVPLKKQ